jgi:uncharacterized protein (TIGR04255 family)
MSLTFKKAPLAELIAELKWVISGAPAQPAGIPPGMSFPLMSSAATEEFYMRFGALAHRQGFTSAERIFPPGFPAPLYQPVYRYKKSQEVEAKEILQVGPGVFSANALRPYQSWNVFRPSVQAGIDALIAARSESESATPFNSVTLRYINSFTKEFTGGRDSATFVRDVLGIHATLPVALTRHMVEGTLPIPNFGFLFQTKNGLRMQVTAADAVIEGGEALVLDMLVQSNDVVAPDTGAVLGVLDAARKILHDSFIEMTKSIGDVMQPDGEDGG